MAKEKTKKPVKAPDRFTEAFMPETDEKLQKISAIFFVLGIVCAVWFSTIELVVDEIMFEDVENEELVATMDMEEKKEEIADMGETNKNTIDAEADLVRDRASLEIGMVAGELDAELAALADEAQAARERNARVKKEIEELREQVRQCLPDIY